jgi:hypothetical protein
MAASTGVILAVGGVTMFNQVILNKQDMDWRVPVATGFAAMIFTGLEKVNKEMAVGIAWVALLTVLLARIDANTPAPVETLLKEWNKGR